MKRSKKVKFEPKSCQQCNKSFLLRKRSKSRLTRGRFCSKNCFYLSRFVNPKEFVCKNCSKVFPNTFHQKKLIYCSKICWGNARVGHKFSIDTRIKMSKAQTKRTLEGKNPNWKGGIWPKHLAIRRSLEYKFWREAVFKRDNLTCVWCRQIGRKLNADHIKPFADYPELRFAIDNGRALCIDCHRKTGTFGRRKLKNKYEIKKEN